jgi:molybdopterin-binding protein
MNTVDGIISEIESADTISNVKIDTDIGNFHCLILENPDTANYLKTGNKVKLIFKDADFIICKEKIYSFNTFEATIKSLSSGKIVSTLTVESKNYKFSILLSNQEAKGLKTNEKVFLYIKPTNIIIEV